MQTVDLIISPRWLCPIAPQNSVLENHSVIVKDERIIDILPTEQASKQYQASESLNMPDHVLMPGLVNAHAHTPMSLFRGLADDLDLMDWLQNYIWPAESTIINEESVHDGSELALAEMIRGGTTCFNDHYMMPHISANVAKKCGMRGVIGLQMMDVPTLWAENGEQALQKGLDIFRNTPSHPLISWCWAPHAPYTTTDETFSKLKSIAAETDLPIHIHLNETQAEIQQDLEKYGKRPIARLNDLGLVNDKLIAVHMVHLNDEEIGLIKDKGTHVVHCPESNMKLASGLAPISKLLEQGINVALGTDGAASNNDLDMFGELQTAAFVAKVQSGNPKSLPAPEALKMATLNGAKALGLDKEIGSLEKGKAADMIAIDLSSYLTQPVYHPMSHLAYAVNRLQVSDVWVAGKRLLKQGELTTLNAKEIVKKAHKWAKQAEQFKSAASTVAA